MTTNESKDYKVWSDRDIEDELRDLSELNELESVVVNRKLLVEALERWQSARIDLENLQNDIEMVIEKLKQMR